MVTIMKLFSRLSGTVVAFMLLVCTSCSCSSSSTLPPETRVSGSLEDRNMEQIYDFVRSYQNSYIRSLQLPSGAIKDNAASDSKITPYFANFAAMALLTEPLEKNISAVKKYMLWYFGKLNGTVTAYSNNEIAGSVYDYMAPGETTKGTYDSVDSYAATFLELSDRFSSISAECKAWLMEHHEELGLVCSAMCMTVDCAGNLLPGENVKDCLSIAHYGYPIKYLMDNSEVNMGLKAAGSLKDKGLLVSSYDLDALLAGNSESVRGLYNASKANYDYAKANPSVWSKFYPDATAQLYPCLFGVVPANDSRSVHVYEMFNSTYPDWASGVVYFGYPWTMVAYAAAAMGDQERVDSYVTHIYGLNVKGEQKDLWYDAEAGALLLAIDKIRNK